MSNSALSIRNLSKTYRDKKSKEEKHALKDVSLEVKKGAFFGLLGANGAGKSTMINIMAGLVHKSSGEVLICGHDIISEMRAARMSLGVVPQELVLDSFFTVRQALEIHAGYYGVEKAKRRTDELIEAMGLKDKADINSRRLSGGMRRRLLIAKALVHSPDVLVLDEPTAGVDVELRTQLWDYVRKLNESGTTILLTTHYLEEAEALCDDIAIIDNGEIITHTSKDELIKEHDSKKLVIKTSSDINLLPEDMIECGWQIAGDNLIEISYRPSVTNVEKLFNNIKTNGIEIADISVKETKLEDVFLRLTA